MTKNELINYIELDQLYDDPENQNIWAVSDLDMTDTKIENEGLKGFKYCVFFEQSYITYPIPAHFEPVPNEYNDMLMEYGY